jgi:hypothetical protein
LTTVFSIQAEEFKLIWKVLRKGLGIYFWGILLVGVFSFVITLAVFGGAKLGFLGPEELYSKQLPLEFRGIYSPVVFKGSVMEFKVAYHTSPEDADTLMRGYDWRQGFVSVPVEAEINVVVDENSFEEYLEENGWPMDKIQATLIINHWQKPYAPEGTLTMFADNVTLVVMNKKLQTEFQDVLYKHRFANASSLQTVWDPPIYFKVRSSR